MPLELTTPEAMDLARRVHADPLLAGELSPELLRAALWELARYQRALHVALMDAVFQSPQTAVMAAGMLTASPSYDGTTLAVVRCGTTREGLDLYALTDQQTADELRPDDTVMVVPA